MNGPFSVMFFVAGAILILGAFRITRTIADVNRKSIETCNVAAILTVIGIAFIAAGIIVGVGMAGESTGNIPIGKKMMIHSSIIVRGNIAYFSANLLYDNESAPVLYHKKTAYIHNLGEIMPGDTVTVEGNILYKVKP